MRLTAGTRLGHFEIHSFLGKGAMGEVYRAQDTRARRAVALKVLHPQMSEREAIRRRFEREGRVLAGLSHPHICAFQEIGQADGIDFLVMEYIEGQNLAQVLEKGPLPLDKVLLYATQICSALDASHQLGLTHRDLKPANIIVARSGIKILDFGLAKIGGPLGGSHEEAEDEESTVAEAMTEAGTILGTYQYMAPEQLEGKAVDPRADIFSFGAVLHEMLTGRKAFEGRSKAGTIASVLTQQPEKLSSLRPDVAPTLEWVLDGCLAKDAGDRWQTIRDVKRGLDLVSVPAPAPVAAAVQPHTWRWIALCVLLAVVAGWAWFSRQPGAVGETVRFQLLPPAGHTFAPFASHGVPALSPDGRRIVFPVWDRNRNASLWIRDLGTIEARPLEATVEAKFTVWSPDGRYIAYVQGNEVKRAAIEGGPVQTICSFTSGVLFGWDEDGSIYLTAHGRPIFRVPAQGGVAEQLTVFEKGDMAHFSFQRVAGTREFLYSVQSEAQDGTGIYASSLDNPRQRKRIVDAFSSSVYDGKRLIYQSGERLFTAGYNPATRRVASDSNPLEPQVAVYPFTGVGDFAASREGTLIFRTGKTTSQRELAWFDREGNRQESLAQGMFRYPGISPDGETVAAELIDMNRALGDLWVLGAKSQFRRRISFDPASESYPVFTPDGNRILYSLTGNLYMRDAQGGGNPELLYASGNPKAPTSITSDGRYLLFRDNHPTNGGDLWVLPLQGGNPIPFLTTKANARDGVISPDGKWVAYSSDEDGRMQIFVERFAPEGTPRERVQVTTRGGTSVQWRQDSREIFFFGSAFFLAAKVGAGPKLVVSSVERLFRCDDSFHAGFSYTPSPDGQRLLLSAAVGEQRPETHPITVVLHHPGLGQR